MMNLSQRLANLLLKQRSANEYFVPIQWHRESTARCHYFLDIHFTNLIILNF